MNQKFNPQERQRKIDAMAAEIYARMVVTGIALQTELSALAYRARRMAETFYADEPVTGEVQK